MHVTSVDGATFEAAIHDAGARVPIEQSALWAGYDSGLPGRQHWRFLLASDEGRVRAALSLTEFSGRFLTQLWAKNGPVWLGESPTAAEEAAFRDGLRAYVRTHHPKASVVRLHATHPALDLHEPLIAVFYDHTVILDLTKSEDELLADMSKSGRRDLRYGLKRPDLVFAEETDISRADFDREIYAVFAETAERGGFHLRPAEFYYTMLTELAPACRLFTIRRDGQVLSWAIVTSYDGAVNYYFAASTAAARDTFATYRQVWEVIRLMQAEGATTFDFLGTGSDRAPGLASLDGFKLKFTKSGAVAVPGPWDMHVRPRLIATVRRAEKILSGVKQAPRRLTRGMKGLVEKVRSPGKADRNWPAAPSVGDEPSKTQNTAPTTAHVMKSNPPLARIQPVVLDFTVSGYALARAFHEAYGLTSIAVVPFTAGATKWSSLFSEHVVQGRDALKNYALVLDALREIAARDPHVTIIPLTNNDAYVLALADAAAHGTLSPNIIVPHESAATIARVSDKAAFAAECANVDVATPATVVLDFADEASLDAGRIEFSYPIIVKPASSAAYNALNMTGKKKLFHVGSAAELTELVARFARAGFTGKLLAQDLIPGDDIYSVTAYRAADGRITTMRTAKVLMQDPRPAFLGIPDAHIVTDLPELAAPATRFLAALDWHGFANFDAIRDPRTGQYVFFEVNPRYGRNCHYATATGANVAHQLVADLIDSRPHVAPPLAADLLYTVLPPVFVQRALEPRLAARVRHLRRTGAWSDPLKYRGEKSWRHRAYAVLTAWNHARTYRKAARTVSGG